MGATSKVHGCARNETCQWQSDTGLHADGSPCRYGKASLKSKEPDSMGLFELVHTLMEMYERHGTIEVGFGGAQTYDRITRVEFVDGCRIKLIGEEE